MKKKPFMKSRNLAIIILIVMLFFPLIITQAQEGGFTEYFDNPELPGWDHSQGVFIEGNNLHIEPGNLAAHGGDWDIAHVSTRIRLPGEGLIVVNYRSNPSGAYLLVFGPDFILSQRESPEGSIEMASNHQVKIPMEEWFQVDIIINGGDQSILINGEAVLEATDNNPLPPGGIGFETLDGAYLEVDDLTISFASEIDPDVPISDTATDKPEVTEDSSITSTGEFLPTSQLKWTYTGGPPGGLGYDIRYNFEDSNIWYVTDSFAGLFRSTDNGLTWEESSNGIASTGVDLIPVFSVTVDPHNPNIVWVGTQNTGHIYKSTDYGVNWTQKDSGVVHTYTALHFRGFTVDPKSSDIVYAMAETTSHTEEVGGQVFRTKNGGESWELIWDGGMPSALARYMWIDPDNTQVLYVSTGIFDRDAVGPEPYSNLTSGLGVLKSTDGGETWEVQNFANGLEMLHIGSLYMHPENPDILLAAAGHVVSGEEIGIIEREKITPSGIYRTVNGGEHWDKVLSAPELRPAETFSSVEICPSDPNIAYAASLDAVYRSGDAGITWKTVGAEFGWGPPGILAGFPIDIQCDPDNPDRLFINNYGGGNFLSEDGGKTWSNASQGYSGANIMSVAVDPNQPGRIFTTGGTSGIWGSYDGGITWLGLRPENIGIFQNGPGVIAVDPKNSDHLISGGRPGFVIMDSYDAGNNWNHLWSMGDKEVFFESRDGQEVTDFMRDVAVPTSIVFAPSNPETVYLGGLVRAPIEPYTEGIGVFISKDSGKTWRQTNDTMMRALSPFSIAVDPTNENILYAGTGGGLFKSTDGGDSWNELNLLEDSGYFFAVAVNPFNPDHILAGAKLQGIFVSQDGGINWSHGAAGWEPNGIPTDIVFDPNNPQRVYMGDFFSGVYVSDNAGLSWQKINEGLKVRAVTDLTLSSDSAHLYAGTLGAGVLRMDLFGKPPKSGTPITSTHAEYIGEGVPLIEDPVTDETISDEGEEISEELIQDDQQDEEKKKIGFPCLGGALPLFLFGLFWIEKRRK